MAAEASPPRLGRRDGGACQKLKGVLLGGDPLRGTPRRETSVRSSQAGTLVVGHGSVSRICRESHRGGRPVGETEPLAREGSQGRWLAPTTPKSKCAPRSYKEVTGVGGHGGESPSQVTEGVPTKRGGAASTVWGEESVMLRGYGRSPPIGLARALLTARLRPRYRRCLRPSD